MEYHYVASDPTGYMLGAAALLIIGIAIGAAIVACAAPWPWKDRDKQNTLKAEAERNLLEAIKEHYTSQAQSK
jgi:hypothetical protein